MGKLLQAVAAVSDGPKQQQHWGRHTFRGDLIRQRSRPLEVIAGLAKGAIMAVAVWPPERERWLLWASVVLALA